MNFLPTDLFPSDEAANDEPLPEVDPADKLENALDLVSEVLGRVGFLSKSLPKKVIERMIRLSGDIDSVRAFAEFLDRLRAEVRIAYDSAREDVHAAAAAGGRTRSIVERAIAEFQAEKDVRTRQLFAPNGVTVAEKIERVKDACLAVAHVVEEEGGGGNAALAESLWEAREALADLEDAAIRGQTS
jgi:hypothetical protein